MCTHTHTLALIKLHGYLLVASTLHTYIHTYIYTYTNIHVGSHGTPWIFPCLQNTTYIYTCMHACAHTYKLHGYFLASTTQHTHIYMHTHTYTHIYTYIHTCIHTYRPSLNSMDISLSPERHVTGIKASFLTSVVKE